MVHLQTPKPTQKPDTHSNNTSGNDQSAQRSQNEMFYASPPADPLVAFFFFLQSHLPHHTISTLCIKQLDVLPPFYM